MNKCIYVYLLAIFNVAIIDNFKNIILVTLYSTLLMLSEVMFNVNYYSQFQAYDKNENNVNVFLMIKVTSTVYCSVFKTIM